MKLSKKLRQQAAEISRLNDVIAAGSAAWHADRAAEADTRAALIRLRDKHSSFSARSPYGRHGATELRCTQCTTQPYPCPTWRGLDQLVNR